MKVSPFLENASHLGLEIEKASTSMQLTAKNDTVKGAGTVELQLCRQGIPEDAGIKVTCDVSGITLEEKGTDHWIATLPIMEYAGFFRKDPSPLRRN